LREMTAAIRSELLLLPNEGADKHKRGWAGPGSWN